MPGKTHSRTADGSVHRRRPAGKARDRAREWVATRCGDARPLYVQAECPILARFARNADPHARSDSMIGTAVLPSGVIA